jgi:hypothetical protein
MMPYGHIDVQLNSELSSIQKEPIQSLDSQNKFLTKINMIVSRPANLLSVIDPSLFR